MIPVDLPLDVLGEKLAVAVIVIEAKGDQGWFSRCVLGNISDDFIKTRSLHQESRFLCETVVIIKPAGPDIGPEKLQTDIFVFSQFFGNKDGGYLVTHLIAGPQHHMPHFFLFHDRAEGLNHESGFDAIGGHSIHHAFDTTQRSRFHIFKVHAIFCEDIAQHVMKSGSHLGNAHPLSLEIAKRPDPFFPGIIAHHEPHQFIPRPDPALVRHDTDLQTIGRRIVKARGQPGSPQVNIAGSQGHGHRLSRFHEFQFHIKAFICKISLLESNK